LYWRLISRVRKPQGRKRLAREIRNLIFRMVAENPTWGAPRVHGELLILGFDVAEKTISRWMRRAPRDPEPGKRWLMFLRNHREAIGAMDFFRVPTITFGILYCFFIISHDRRRILHFNVTKHRRACGGFNYCDKHSPLIRLPDSSCSIGTPNTALRFR
jgi:putative transposase